MNNINYFFNPKTVAVIGASEKSVGKVVFENFLSKKFKGKVFPVNSKYKKIKSKKCYKSVLEIKQNIDHAIIAVPAKSVPLVLKQCIEKKVKTATILTSGFSEIGKRKLENELKKTIKKSEVRVIGPNCLGTLNSKTSADSIFLPKNKLIRPKKGSIAVISQSGAVGSLLLDYMTSQNLGISKFVSYGNAIDINETDLIEFLSEDKSTKVIACYIEGIKNGKKFIETCKKCKKPIVILKGGLFEKSAKAVSSHTGSLAGDGKIYSGAFKQAGAIQAENWQELFDIAKAYSQPVPKGRKMLVVTDGGGFGILATDAASKKSIKIPVLPKSAISKLKKMNFPEYCILSNPLDLSGDVSADRLAKALDIVLKEKSFDFVLLIALFQVPNLGKEAVKKIIQINKKHRKKPLFVVSAGADYAKNLSSKMIKQGIPVYETPEQAVGAVSKIILK